MLLFDLLYLIFIVLSLPLWAKFLIKKEYAKLTKNRFSPDIKRTAKKRIWIHAVSLGEVKSLSKLIEKLMQEFKRNVVLSVTTPTGYQYAKKEYKNIEVINSPFDISFVIRRFIQRINPEILILNELEMWPNWILILKKSKVPIVLINGRISENAFKRYKAFLFIFKSFFNKIDLYLVQANLYKERFSQFKIPPSRIKLCGNVKADEAFNISKNLCPDRDILSYLKIKNKSAKIVTLASSHEEDEKLMLTAINQLRSRFSFIFAPRHLDRLKEIEKTLNDNQIPCQIWSQSASIDLSKNVLIFDQIGYLFNILKISDIIYMGGTLSKKIGGHNLYEPAILGKLIFGGPHYNNFPDIGADLKKKRVYRIVNNPTESLQFLENCQTINLDEIKTRAIKSVIDRKGSIECILKNLPELITS